MRYALNFPNGGRFADPRTMAELAQVAEAAGWDGVFVEDYLIWQGHQKTPTYDPWILLAAMAARTERVRLGTMVAAVPRRRPWKLAKEAVTLDHLSGGRLILGVGLGEAGGSSGFSDPSFTHFGEPASNRVRAQMLDEALEVINGLWSGRAFSYAGQYYQVKQVTLLPRPVQAPRIPIWVGGGWPRPGPTRRAARWDGACLYKATPASPLEDEDYTPGEIRQMRATFESQGAPPSFEIALGGRHRGSDWEAERALIAALAQAGATWWIEYLPPTIARTLPALRELVARGPLRIE